MSEIVTVNNLGKKYKHFANRWSRVLHVLSNGNYKIPEERFVLNDINFSVAAGEALGIVGQNGSGKSTLLKIISGITYPSHGYITVKGNIAALLELGMGFNPELTGRQNAQMACQLSGYNKRTIQELMPVIVEFAEIGSYFDQPLRTYSSGMQMRLAFSAATAMRPDILIVDEALSVGDAYFQQKCIARIREFIQKGTNLFFVSHDATAVKSLCDRAVLLEEGKLILDSNPDNVFNYYNAIITQKQKDLEIKQVENERKRTTTRSGNGKAKIENVELLRETGEPCRAFVLGEVSILRCHIRYHTKIDDASFGIVIRDRLGNNVFGTNTYFLKHAITTPGLIEIEFRVKLNLGFGTYSITVASHTRYVHTEDNHDWWDNSIIFEVIPKDGYHFVGVSHLPVEVFSKTLEGALEVALK